MNISTRTRLRNLLNTAARRVTGTSTPADATVTAPASADLFTADEMPPAADIAAAAEKYFRAAEQARNADRAKRAARKLLNRLPAGRYGLWDVERVANAREVADLDAIRATYKALGLGDVPMKRCAPSLTVTLAPELADTAAHHFLSVAAGRA